MNALETAHTIVEQALRATLHDRVPEFSSNWEEAPLGNWLNDSSLPKFLNHLSQQISEHGGTPATLPWSLELDAAVLLQTHAGAIIHFVAQNLEQTPKALAESVARIGKYRIIETLGQGGMGETYLALDDLDQQVVVKTLPYSSLRDETARRKAQAIVATLSHPNLLAIHEIGVDRDIPFIAAEYVEGDSLDRIISSGKPLDLSIKLGIVEQICQALEQLHEKGIVHRSLRPTNVILQPNGIAKVTDLGITGFETPTRLTQAGLNIGTPSYMSPERITGQSIDGRSDIFSAGVILSELLTGQPPFAGNSDYETIASIVRQQHSPLNQYLKDYPPALDTIIDRALAKDPNARFSTAGEFAAALHEVREGLRLMRLESGPPASFTEFFKTASEKSKSSPDTQPTQNDPSSSAPEAGSVTRLIQRLSEPAKSNPSAPVPDPRASGSGPGEFTRMISSSAPQPPASATGRLFQVMRARAASMPAIAAPPSFASTPAQGATLVHVFYATDRLQLPKLSGDPKYGKQRSLLGSLHYGACEVSIPKSHKLGKLETPSILRLEFTPNPAKHILLAKTSSLEERAFFAQVQSSVARSKAKDAFIFVHGYNVSFEDAARRTGQIAYDLDFIGAPIFYSWPSNGKTLDYPKDEANITWSTPHFQRFLTLLAQNSGAGRIHIIAHSMGNRAVCDALKTLSYDTTSSLKLNHLVLAAPDIDAETFQELAATLQKLSGRITLYESSKDRALLASKKLHGNPRAGEPLLVIPGLDTIDASAIDTDFLGHSYFSDSWPLLSDIHSILFSDSPPSTRFGLTECRHQAGTYYAFRA